MSELKRVTVPGGIFMKCEDPPDSNKIELWEAIDEEFGTMPENVITK